MTVVRPVDLLMFSYSAFTAFCQVAITCRIGSTLRGGLADIVTYPPHYVH